MLLAIYLHTLPLRFRPSAAVCAGGSAAVPLACAAAHERRMQLCTTTVCASFLRSRSAGHPRTQLHCCEMHLSHACHMHEPGTDARI